MKKHHSLLNEKTLAEAILLCESLGLSLEDNIKSHSKKRIIILTDENRLQVFKKLEHLGYSRDISIKGSSQGGYKKDDIEIIVKNKTLNGFGGAGIENETIFVYHVSKSISDSHVKNIDININSTFGNNISYSYIQNIEHIGKEGEKKGWKGDVKIESHNYSQNISIKKDGGYRWESAMTRYQDVYNTFMDKAHKGLIPNLELRPDINNPKVLQMINPENNKPYGRIYIKNTPDLLDNLESIMFGNDNAKIIQRTFTDSDFYFCTSSNALHVTTTKNISSVSELSEHEYPILEFERNASKATRIEGWKGRGIVLRISPQEKKLKQKENSKANNLTIDYECIYDL